MITFHPGAGIWVSRLPYAANYMLKAAGWKFHGLPTDCRRRGCLGCRASVVKGWWTDSAEAVRNVNTALWDSAAARAVKEHEATVQASLAADCEDIAVPSPPGLEYLPFQRAGIAYIRDAPRPRRVLLGDQMGLGKTVQAIGWANLSQAATVLVVCPASLKLNWQRELERWLVEPRNIYVVDSSRQDPPADAEIVIVNYERLIRPRIHNALMGWWWQILICDEAHNLKSEKAKRTIAVLGNPGNRKKKIPAAKGLIDRAGSFLPLTGTAMLNRPIELWTLVHTLDPDGFPDKHAFGKRYCGGVQKRIGWDPQKRAPRMAWDFSGASNLPELQDKLRGRCMVRRLKRDVLKELPPKRHEILVLKPRGPVRDLIKHQMKQWEKTRGASKVADLDQALESGDRARYEAVVAELSAELEVTFEELAKERRNVAIRKVMPVVEHIRNLIEVHDIPRIVIFAHHHEVIDQIRAEFRPIATGLDGRTPAADRQRVVDLFQAPDGPRLFVAGIRAAGEGITLTAASHEVFAELDWTPARNMQAEDRCHRIGQRDMVLIQHLVFDGSLDALIAKTLIHKMRIAEQVLDRNPAERARGGM